MRSAPVHRHRPPLVVVQPQLTDESLQTSTHWTPLSAGTLARLVAWRELHARWPLHLLMGIALALTWAAPPRWEDSAVALAAFGLCAYALALGLGSKAREEALWTGLGGTPWWRELVTVVVQAGLVLAAAACIRGPEPSFIARAAGAALGLMALAGFARSWAGSHAGRLLLAVGAVIAALLTVLPSLWIAKWPLALGGQVRLLLLVVGCVVLRLVLAGRRPTTAAGRKRRGWAWVALPLSLVSVSAVEAAWWEPVGGRFDSLDQLIVPDDVSPWTAAQRVWTVGDDWSVRATELLGPVYAVQQHESGTLLYGRPEDHQGWPVGLTTAEGETSQCHLPAFAQWSWTAEDGRTTVWLLQDGSIFEHDLAGCRAAASIPDGVPDQMVTSTGTLMVTPGPRPGTVITRRNGVVGEWDLVTGDFR